MFRMNWGLRINPRYVYITLGIVLIGGATWYTFFRQSGPEAQVLVVHPASFAQQISVSGTVKAAEDVDLGFTQSGRVSGVYTKVGNTVRTGTLLAQIENGELRAALAQKRAALQTAQADLASLQAGTRHEQLAVTEAQIESDTTAFTQTNTAVVDAIRDAYTRSDDAVHNKLDQIFSNPRTNTPSLTFTTSNSQLENSIRTQRVVIESTLASWEITIAGFRPESDLIASSNVTQANLTAVMSLLADSNTALNSAIPNAIVTSAKISTYITDIATARASLNTVATALNSAVTSQKAAAAKLAMDKKSLALEQAGSTTEDIDAQRARVTSAQADVQSAQAQLEKTLVVVPFTGIITRMDAKVGEIISPGAPQISVISTGIFQIETFIPEVGIIGLSVGNSATTTLDAYGGTVQFTAQVIAIDPAETTVNGISTYKTTLQFLQKDERIKPGMTAAVVITTDISPNALVVPQGAIFIKDGRQIVQILQGRSRVDVPIQTGKTSALGSIEILSGLKDGDSVVLNPDASR